MKQIQFSLPNTEGQQGLTFITYLMKQIHLDPGETKVVTIRDTATGWYEDWTDTDIVDYYENRYSEYGLQVSVLQNQENYP